MSDTHAPHSEPHSSAPIGLDDPKGTTVALIGLISTVLTIVLILVIQGGYYFMESIQFEEKFVKIPRPKEATDLEAAQRAALSAPASVVDKSKKQIHLPINQTMESVQQQLLAEQQKAHGTKKPAGHGSTSGGTESPGTGGTGGTGAGTNSGHGSH